MWTCVWMLALENPRGRWGVRWPCPSCTRHRWCCTDTGGSEHWWTRRSCSETSSTWALAWWEDNPHCPVDKKRQTEAFLVLLLKGLEIPFSRNTMAHLVKLFGHLADDLCVLHVPEHFNPHGAWSHRHEDRCHTYLYIPIHIGLTGCFRLYFCGLYLCIPSTGWKNWWDLTAPSPCLVYTTRSTRPPQTKRAQTKIFNVSFPSGNRFLLSTT